jgi:citrate synthase
MSQASTRIATTIWHEENEPDNPFAAHIARCRGYDVYGDLLGRASWTDMLFLLFRGEAPTLAEATTLETLAVALANPGPRDPSVHAAMCGGIGGSTSASCLMAALAVGAGQLGGAREIATIIESWKICLCNEEAWAAHLSATPRKKATIWPETHHIAGFDPHASNTSLPVRQTLHNLAEVSPGKFLPWLRDKHETLEKQAASPLSMTGVSAAALADLGFSPDQGEMLYLLLRLPGAAAHALEQKQTSHRDFPFFSLNLTSPAGDQP